MIWNKRNTTRRLGLIVPSLWMISLTACAPLPPKNVKTVPDYAPDFLEAVAVEAGTCGPHAQEALFDWLVLIGG